MGDFSRYLRSTSLAGAAVLGAATLLAAAPAYAQAVESKPAATDDSAAGVEEIVVTAQHRSENLQAVPIAISAISASALAKSGVTNSLSIGQVVPAVQITRSGPQTILFIRGVGNSSGAVGEEGANAWYLDGVYLGDQSSVNLDFNNIERIEVLKGPQGTLFGRNASGGLIHIITRDPGDKQVVKASFGYGNYKTLRGQFYAATPLTDNLAADIAITGSDQKKGWGTNLATGNDYMKAWFFAVRSKVVWRPGADTKVTWAGDVRRSADSTGTAFPIYKGSKNLLGQGYYGDYNANTNLEPVGRIKNWGASMVIEQQFDWATLTSVSAHRFMRSNSSVDSDSGPTPLIDVNIQSSSSSYQQELRLASNTGGPLTWQVGLFYYNAVAKVLGQTPTGLALGAIGRGNSLVNTMKTNSYAAFGEVTYDITPTTHLTGGLRYTSDKRSLIGGRYPINQPTAAAAAAVTILNPDGSRLRDHRVYKKLTYRAAIRQELGDDVNVYASYNRGFKAGLYGLSSPPNLPPVKPQVIDAFDAGIKTQLLDNILRLNVSAFHYKIKGYQVRSALPGGGNTSILLNATSVTSKGGEAELEFAPTKELRITSTLAYLDSKFGNFPNFPYTVPNPRTCVPGVNPPYIITGPVTGGNNSTSCFGPATGNRTANSPKWAFNLGANYTADIGDNDQIIASILYTYKSTVYFDASNRTGQKGFGILNGSLEYKPSPNLGIELWGKNLTKKVYYVLNLEGTVDQAGFGAPRTYGVNVKFDF